MQKGKSRDGWNSCLFAEHFLILKFDKRKIIQMNPFWLGQNLLHFNVFTYKNLKVISNLLINYKSPHSVFSSEQSIYSKYTIKNKLYNGKY